jgi:hypothetical protein
MNRTLLKDVFVLDGMYYANDALQWICSNISNYSNSAMLELQSRSFENASVYDSREFKDQRRAQNNMIILFNSIVERGHDFAIKFIHNNLDLI